MDLNERIIALTQLGNYLKYDFINNYNQSNRLDIILRKGITAEMEINSANPLNTKLNISRSNCNFLFLDT